MKKYILLLLIFTLFPSFGQHKEESTASPKPKIGLVLSGGGAKGFAHVGILKVIDRLGITLDYIGGTSMGAAVGALYATGYSPKQIDSIIMDIDFTAMLTDKIDRKHYSFFQKKNSEKYLLSFPVKKFKIGLPVALSKGQNTLNELNKIYHPVDHIKDFSKLPVPFFCMTTDIETGKAIEINKGSLSNAIRSSASLPTLLNPNKLDSIMTIDGGVANNFPIKNMRDKGIDIIIGVDVQGSLKKSKNIDSALKVVDQIVNFQLYGKEYSEESGIDIYIRPDVKDFGLVEFESKRNIIDSGEKAANKKLAALIKLSTNQPPRKDLFHNPNKEYVVNRIVINGRKYYTRKYILGTLKLKSNTPISQEELNVKINNLTATNNFDKIEYDFIENPSNGTVDIVFNIIESEQSEFVRLGARYDPLYEFSGLFNYTKKHILKQNDIFSLDVAIGDNIRGEFNYFIDNGYFIGYGLRTHYNQFETTIENSNFANIDRINFKYEDTSNYIYAQSGLSTRLATISLGLEHKFIQSSTNNFNSEDNDRTFFDNRHYLNFLGKFELDSFDRKSFPNKGFKINITFRSFLEASDKENFIKTSQALIDLQGIRTISDRLSLFLQGEGGVTLTNKILDNFNYALGGYGENFINNFVPFHGYTFSAIEGNSFLKTTASVRYRVYKEHYVDFLANYAVAKDDIFDFLKTSSYFNNAKSGYSIGYGTNTFLGPLHIRYAWSPENNFDNLLISVGFWF